MGVLAPSRPSSPRRQRRPRFTRAAPPPLRLTDDDVALIGHVAKHRFLRSTHLVALIERPAKKIVERLGVLFHAGYLDRPRAQLDYYSTAGSAPLVYALGNRGATLLAETHEGVAPKVDWTDKNRTARRPFIEHTLLIADVMVAFERALWRHPDIRLMEPAEILSRAPEATRRSRSPWAIRARVTIAGLPRELSLVPDKVFGLDDTVQRKRTYFFLEADRATMPVQRTSLAQTSIARKFMTYWHAHRAGEHTRQLGIGNFRVLTVTSTRERIASMIDAARAITGGSGSNQFLFADRAAVQTTKDILALRWISGRNELVTL